MAILSKGCKRDNFESHNSLKLALSILGVFIQIWLKVNLFFNQTLLTFLHCVRQTWMNWFWKFLCEGLSPFNLKGLFYSYTWSCSLCEGRTSFCMGFISRKLCGFCLCFWLALLYSVSYFFSSIDHLLCLYAWFFMLFDLTYKRFGSTDLLIFLWTL